MKKHYTLKIFCIVFSVIMICLTALAIFYLSAQNTSQTEALTQKFMILLQKILPEFGKNQTYVSIRQLAHLPEYFALSVFSVMLFVAIFDDLIKSVGCSIALCAVVSLSDQIFKMLLPAREFEALDLCIDGIGYIAGIFLFCLLSVLVYTILEKVQEKEKIKLPFRKMIMIGALLVLEIILVSGFFIVQKAQVNAVSSAEEESQLEDERLREECGSGADAYTLLKAGVNIRILILGDSIATSYGDGSGLGSSWTSLLEYQLAASYGITPIVNNLSLEGNGIYASYAQFLMTEEPYDLVIICNGLSSNADEFGGLYESLVRAVIKKNSSASIIAVEENISNGYDEYTDIIENLAASYKFQCADVVRSFIASGVSYNELASYRGIPTSEGQYLYYTTIMDLIDTLAASDEVLKAAFPQPVYENILDDSNAKVIPASDFTREGNTFILEKLTIDADSVGMDFVYTPGKNSVKVYMNNRLVYNYEDEWSYEFTQRHILKIADALSGKYTCRIEFSQDSQADSFSGLIID